MNNHKDGFDQYPHYPGSQGGETSAEAAAELAPSLGRMQRMVQHAITKAGLSGLTGDEIGERTGINKYTVRARTAELRKAGVIADSVSAASTAQGGAQSSGFFTSILRSLGDEPDR